MNLNENIQRIREVMGLDNNSFDNWVKPSMEDLQREYRIEHDMKGLEAFDSFDDFLSAVNEGEVVTITPEEDDEIGGRSQTSNQESLLKMIRGYRSYPEFRNEGTVQAIYDGFKNNNEMVLPIVIEYEDGEREVFSGNTRMDIAYQLGITPKVLLIYSPNSLW